jgi:hypothetical protein
VLDGDLVAEEPRCAGTRVRDQGFLLRQFQSEVIPEELGQALFDLFGLARGPTNLARSSAYRTYRSHTRILRIRLVFRVAVGVLQRSPRFWPARR